MYGEDKPVETRDDSQAYEKRRAYDEQCAAQASPGQYNPLVGALNKGRMPLRDRVRTASWRAEIEARKVEHLRALADLLDRNPEVARILELIEQTGV